MATKSMVYGFVSHPQALWSDKALRKSLTRVAFFTLLNNGYIRNDVSRIELFRIIAPMIRISECEVMDNELIIKFYFISSSFYFNLPVSYLY